MLKSKKASMADAIYGPAKLLGISIACFIGVFIWLSFNTAFQPLSDNMTPAHNSSLQEAITNVQIGLYSVDYIFPFIVFGLLLVSLIFAFKVGANVIYSVLSLVLWALAMIFAAVFTNVFGQFQDSFPGVATALPIITYLMNNMKWIVLVWLFLITVVMFTRNKQEDTSIRAQEAFYSGGGLQ
jgi:hypothetical protein